MAIFSPPGNSSSSHLSLLRSLLSLSQEISSSKPLQNPPQKRNYSSVLRKSYLLSLLFQDLLQSHTQNSSVFPLPLSVALCFKEISLLLHRSHTILHSCTFAPRTSLLLRSDALSNSFHELILDLSTILNILPISSLRLSQDSADQLLLLKNQCAKFRPFVDPTDETLRSEILSFLDQIERGTAPNLVRLGASFQKLGFEDSRSCGQEIERLERELANHVDEKWTAKLADLIGLVRYGKCVLFGASTPRSKAQFKDLPSEIDCPVDFRCPISMELMRDPVVVSTGQTYDRESINHWIDSGHATCPKSGQALVRLALIPNRALRNQINVWCAERNIPYETEEENGRYNGIAGNKAALEATRMTASLLLKKLEGSPSADVANRVLHELRVLAKLGSDNRACIAEAGAVPRLVGFLVSDDPNLQTNAVTTVLNLSILEANKKRIMDADCSFDGIVHVLMHGATWEAKENAAATVLSLSAKHEYRERFASDQRVIQGLVELVRVGPASSKRDALAAVLHLAVDMEAVRRMVESGVVEAAVEAIADTAEEAVAVLAVLAKRGGAESLVAVIGMVGTLVGVMINGSDRAKECSVAALVAVCRSGGDGVVEKLVRMPRVERVLLELMQSGTARARMKAASLGRICRRWLIAQQVDPTVRYTSHRN